MRKQRRKPARIAAYMQYIYQKTRKHYTLGATAPNLPTCYGVSECSRLAFEGARTVVAGECYQVRFTTRSGLFDATVPHWGCSRTPLFKSVQSASPTAQDALSEQQPDSPWSAAAGRPNISAVDKDGRLPCGVTTFWESLFKLLPPHITAAGSYADGVEWNLPYAPFSAALAFD